ncbi:hypothetical protein [Streptomyces sp. WAC 04229]|uniref:hypothetical protein n=1 Tax=Streptomyces sp. WAC 04229 TaxID=2203206 RepID=UPI003D725FE5
MRRAPALRSADAESGRALDHRIEYGIWGEMAERERRALLRRRPLTTPWRHLLEAARSEHGRLARPDEARALGRPG